MYTMYLFNGHWIVEIMEVFGVQQMQKTLGPNYFFKMAFDV